MKNSKLKTKNLTFCIAVLIFSFFILHFNCFAADQLTITTYYPSPYGSYQELRSQRMAVGNTYINNSVVCWGGAGAGCPGGSVDPGAATSVVVEGNFGIGTIAPAEKLEVSGNIKLSGATRKITNVAEPTDDSDVATKAYVDAKAAGGSVTMLSAESGATYTLANAVNYCRDLSAGCAAMVDESACPGDTFTDWHLPTSEELTQFIQNPTDTTYLWTSELYSPSVLYTLRLSDGYTLGTNQSGSYNERCVR